MEEDIRKENLKMQHLREMLLRDINNSNLQVGSIYYILKDIYKDVENLYNQEVDKEYEQFCKESEELEKQKEEESSSEDKKDQS